MIPATRYLDLIPLAKRYLWWKTPQEVSARPDLLIAQIMNIGTWDDVLALEKRRYDRPIA